MTAKFYDSLPFNDEDKEYGEGIYAEGNWYHTLFSFIDLFKRQPELLVSDLLQHHPKECDELVKLLIKESSKPVLLRK